MVGWTRGWRIGTRPAGPAHRCGAPLTGRAPALTYARRLAVAVVLTTARSGEAAGAASAPDRCWGGPLTGGSWGTAASWQGGVVPGSGDVATIGAFNGGCTTP